MMNGAGMEIGDVRWTGAPGGLMRAVQWVTFRCLLGAAILYFSPFTSYSDPDGAS